jgi:ATP-binding cassette subfamily F protein 3
MHHGGPVLLSDVTLAVEPGARIGVIGRNGTGKTTLLRLLSGSLDPVEGSVSRQRGVRVATQAQELVVEPGVTVRMEMMRLFESVAGREERLRGLEERLGEHPPEPERARLLAEYERLQLAHEAAGGWDVPRRVEAVLGSLGLPPSALDRTLDTFSGGERNVLGLARVLLSDPDVMLLDEPSNHLDLEGVEWFTRFLRDSRAAVVMVSHNRHLLDDAADEIWEVGGARVTTWTGNYTAFRRQKDEAEALQERRFEVQQRLVRRIEFQARRLKDMANAYDDPGQARRAQSMLKRLERMEKVERPVRDDRRFRATLAGAERHGRIALSVRGFSFRYGDRVVFEDASLEIEHGERVCLVGPNGSGKTTLLREIRERGSWEDPVLRLGKAVRVGEYRQLHDVLDAETTLLDWTCSATGLGITPASELLHRFLFAREDLDRRIGTLSGGEKSRLQLARLVQAKVNFLVLDEPTNHLDIEACEQLEGMLEEFEGTLLVVSHDRYFLDRLVTRVVEVLDHRLVSHKKSFAEWWRDKRAQREGARRGALERRPDGSTAEGGQSPDGEEARRLHEERKARSREEQRTRARLQALEKRIARLEEEHGALAARLEAACADGTARDVVSALSGEFTTLKGEIDRLYGEWEALASGTP